MDGINKNKMKRERKKREKKVWANVDMSEPQKERER